MSQIEIISLHELHPAFCETLRSIHVSDYDNKFPEQTLPQAIKFDDDTQTYFINLIDQNTDIREKYRFFRIHNILIETTISLLTFKPTC